jgi:hypothetical protein
MNYKRKNKNNGKAISNGRITRKRIICGKWIHTAFLYIRNDHKIMMTHKFPSKHH